VPTRRQRRHRPFVVGTLIAHADEHAVRVGHPVCHLHTANLVARFAPSVDFHLVAPSGSFIAFSLLLGWVTGYMLAVYRTTFRSGAVPAEHQRVHLQVIGSVERSATRKLAACQAVLVLLRVPPVDRDLGAGGFSRRCGVAPVPDPLVAVK
jgi:hypothetical protein